MVQRKAQVKICPCCNQIIRRPNQYTLSKNHINTLFTFCKIQGNNKYFETDSSYSSVKKCSPTAMNTQLKYFGVIQHYYDESDSEKQTVNSGKWFVTELGLNFMNKSGTLPFFVVVKDRQVITKGEQVYIDDPKIKWKTEDDIWTDIKSYWSGDKN